MNATTPNSTCIAVPYYGTLSLLPSRLTRIFFLVEVDLAKKTIANLSLKVWNAGEEPSFSSWLKQMGTEGLICSSAYTQQTAALEAEGIWVQSQQEGEVHEVVERWMRTLPETREIPLKEKSRPVRTSRTLKPALKLAERESLNHNDAGTRTSSHRHADKSHPPHAHHPAATRCNKGLHMEREYCLG
jgi:predicted Fe-Mo cluster-binding NifX family protein